MERAEIQAPASPRWGPLINRTFAILWSGEAISYIGDAVFDITLILWIATRIAAGQSWAPGAVSGVLVSVLVPTLLFGPIAGVFVDRWDKRRTMLAMDALRTGLILLLIYLTGLVSLPLAPHPGTVGRLVAIYSIIVLATTCQQLFGPSRMALIGDVVSEDDRPRASGMGQITNSLSVIIGPPLGATLFFHVGIQWALLLNALSFAASFFAIWIVKAPESARSVAAGEKGNVRRELIDGLRFYLGNRVLVTILVTVIVAMLGAGALNALDVFFVTINLHTSASLYGWMSAGFGVGAICGGILASVFGSKIRPTLIFWGGMLLTGLGLLIYSRLTSFVPALILLMVFAVPISGLNVAVMPLILSVTPRDMIGRTVSVLQPAVSLASIGSIALAGVLVSTVMQHFHTTFLGMSFGPVDTIFSAAAFLCLIAGVYAYFGLREPPAVEAAEPEVPSEAAVG